MPNVLDVGGVADDSAAPVGRERGRRGRAGAAHSTHLFIRSILTIRTRMRVTVRGLCSLHAAHSEQCLGQRTLRAHTLTSHISHLRGPYRPVLAPGRRPWPSL
eukprot:scaffold16302_cov80-Phaeocystis_antarctica.AAC.2